HESFTLSELSRSLDLNKATCHAMFAAMERHGLLVRNPVEKTYSLGPVLIRLAEAVMPDEQHALAFARGEMAALSDCLGRASGVAGLSRDESVVLAVRVPVLAPASSRTLLVGHRRLWAPPIGPVYAAWGSAAEQNAWLGRAPTRAGVSTRSDYEHVLQ